MNWEYYKLAKMMQAAGSLKSVDQLLTEIGADISSLSPAPGDDDVIGEIVDKKAGRVFEILGDGSRREKQS